MLVIMMWSLLDTHSDWIGDIDEKNFSDNKSTIVLSKNPTFLERFIHINIRFNKIKELIGEKEIVIEYCSTKKQITDIFIKLLKIKIY